MTPDRSMRKAESVGVVIPSYNHAGYVGDAVRSVLSQTIDRLSLVVVDDGSADDSVTAIRDAIAEFPGRDARVIEQENRGAHAAIGRGMDVLADLPEQPRVCAVLNSDDLYEPDRFERMVPSLEGTDLAIAFSGLSLIDDHGEPLGVDHAWPRWYEQALTAAESEPTIGFALLVHNFSVTSGNFVFTRALYDALGGFGDQRFAHDWDFLIRATALTEPVFVREALMLYRVHATNTTESVRGLLRTECATAIERYQSLLERALRLGEANPLAPCEAQWPSFWGRFSQSRKPFWNGHAV